MSEEREAPPSPTTVAFFDLDRTVLSINSASGWIRRELREGHLGHLVAAKGAIYIGMYHLGMARMEAAIHDAVATLSGQEEAAVAARTAAFWNEEVRPTIRPGARRAVEAHRARGEPVVLLTSSSRYLSELAAAELGLDDFLCNRVEVAGGRFTGKALEPLCYGPGKIVHAASWARARGLALDRCTFYTDSFSDLPVLAAMGTPVAISPDPRLLREARRRGWRIEDWD